MSGKLPQVRIGTPWEGACRRLDLWAYHHGVRIDFSRHGELTDNAFIETFNGTFRDECLNLHWFETLTEARAKRWLGFSLQRFGSDNWIACRLIRTCC